MDRLGFLELMEELLEVPAGTLNGHECLRDLDTWDSLALIGFMAMVNEQTGIILAPKVLATCQTVADLMKLVVTSDPDSVV